MDESAVLRQNYVEWSDCTGGPGRKESIQARYFSAAHPQQSKAVLDQKRWQPQIVPYVHHKWHADTVWSKHTEGSKFISTTSVMLLVTSKTIQQNALQDQLGTIKGSCTKDRQKSRRTHQENQADFCASGDRLLDRDQQQKRLDLPKNCVSSILQAPQREELDEQLFQNQDKRTKVDARTAEKNSKQGNIDTTELAVIDETTQCEVVQRTHAKGKTCCTCGVILQELSAGKANTLKEPTAQELVRASSLQWRSGAKDLSRQLSQEARKLLCREAPLPRSTT